MQNLLDEKQAAELIGIKHRTLQYWRYADRGPDYVKISHRCVRYRLQDLEKFLKEHTFKSTKEDSDADATG